MQQLFDLTEYGALVMRVLISGIVGAAVSSFVWFYLEHATNREMGWLAIGVGIVTGLCVNAAAGAVARESIGRAALAVVLTLTAVVGGRAVYAKVMQQLNTVKTMGPVAAVTEEDAGAAAGDDAAAADMEAEEEPIMQIPEGAGGGVKFERPAMNSLSVLDMVWMSVSALAAYILGKGRNVATIPAEGEAVATEESSPDGAAPSV